MQSGFMVRGVLSGLGTLFIELVYIAAAVILGINLLKKEAFYGLLKNAGEGDKSNSQVANAIGIIIYGIIAFLGLLLVKGLAAKILAGN